MSNSISILVLFYFIFQVSTKAYEKKEKKVAELGLHHTFQLKKYQKPEQFQFQVSCQQKAMINFDLSPRLKLLHKNIFLNVNFQANPCLKVSQDTSRIVIDDQHWELLIENICCEKKNMTKVINEIIQVTVRDGFKILGISIKTKNWNIVVPILTNIFVCIFIWFSDFSQPKALNPNALIEFYQNKGNHPSQIDKKTDKKFDAIRKQKKKNQ